MRIIFLDIDGVLNKASTKELCGNYIGIDQKCLEAFKTLINESNKIEETNIVLISSWRIGKDRFGNNIPDHYNYLTKRLKDVDLKIYDEISSLPVDDKFFCYEPRGKEIIDWLFKHQDSNISSILILDDVFFPDYKTFNLTKYLIQTSWESNNGGFTNKHVKKSLEILIKTFELANSLENYPIL